MIELTILMPCLNEAETLAACIVKAQGFLDRSGVKGEVLIADNGSTDGSQKIATDLGARVVPVPRRGYGAALITGIEAAQGRYVIMGDSDDSYDFAALDGFVATLRDGADLVMGNRFRGGIAKGAMPPLHRYLGNPVLSTIGRVLYRTPVGDFHCGMRGFSREAILRLGLTAPGMEFASEMVIKASLAGLRIAEVPTTLSPDGRSRPPHLRSFPDGWRHLKLLLTFAPFSLFLIPGLLLAGLGGSLYAALQFGPLHLGGVTFDIGALILSAMALLVGAQMLWFHLLARSFAVRFGLLPSSPRFERLRGHMSVDAACKLGGALFALGLTSAVASLVYWGRAGFGDLDPSVIARATTMAAILTALGAQAVANGFLWGLLNQTIAKPADAAEPSRLAA